MLVSLGSLVALMAFWIRAVIMKLEIASDVWWAPFFAALLLHQVCQRLVRRKLRRAIARHQSQDQ